MLDLIQILDPIKGYLKLGITLVIVGASLILVNVATHALISNFQERKKDKEKVKRTLKPLLRAAADLISRIVEIQITENPALKDAITNYHSGYPENRLETLVPDKMNRLESTAYRLVLFLSLAKYFERETCDISTLPLLDRIEYFLMHKIAVAMRGNIYQLKLLGTELQEEIATNYLDHANQRRATDLSIGSYLFHLNDADKGKYNSKLYESAMKFFTYDLESTKIGDIIDRNNKHWKQRLVLAHLGIYLIDFYQEMAIDPQWEEHRLFFVSLVRQWNADAPKHLYLYEPGDLEKKNYLITFPAKRTSRQSDIFNVFRLVPDLFGLRELVQLRIKHFSLNVRGSRFGKRHHTKSIHSWGVSIRAKSQSYNIKWDDDLITIYENVRNYLRVRFISM